MRFYTEGGGTLSERLRITSAGYVNIGNALSNTSRMFAVETTHADGGEVAYLGNNDGASNYGGLVLSAGENNGECRFNSAWGNSFFTFYTQDSGGAGERLRITSAGHTEPGTDNGLNLGSSSKRWAGVFANYARLSANLAVGSSSLQSGNVASFKGGSYNQVNIAHSGNSSWGMLLTNSDASSYNSGYHQTTNSSVNSPIAIVNVNNDCLYLGTNNTPRWRVEHDGHFIPVGSGSYDMGSTGKRVRTIYAANALNTSDRNEKNTITESDLGLDFICKLKPVSYKWNQNEGESLDTKTHYGLISQDVEEVIIETGKTLDDFGAVDKPEEGTMGLSYNEFISPLVKAIQEQQEQIETLKAKVVALEGS